MPTDIVDLYWYRGECNDPSWRLVPKIARIDLTNIKGNEREDKLAALELHSFREFINLGASLLSDTSNTWDVINTMQHHGGPTRLLDWTTDLGVALYFALKAHERYPDSEPVIWVLQPAVLNKMLIREEGVLQISGLKSRVSFEDTYIRGDRAKRAKVDPVIAARFPHLDQRMSAQSSRFTIHGDLDKSLDQIEGHEKFLSKMILPKTLVEEAKVFCTTLGKTSFGVLPDLDGLGKQILSRF